MRNLLLYLLVFVNSLLLVKQQFFDEEVPCQEYDNPCYPQQEEQEERYDRFDEYLKEREYLNEDDDMMSDPDIQYQQEETLEV